MVTIPEPSWNHSKSKVQKTSLTFKHSLGHSLQNNTGNVQVYRFLLEKYIETISLFFIFYNWEVGYVKLILVLYFSGIQKIMNNVKINIDMKAGILIKGQMLIFSVWEKLLLEVTIRQGDDLWNPWGTLLSFYNSCMITQFRF